MPLVNNHRIPCAALLAGALIISAPLAAHEDKAPHKHRYNPDTGSLAITEVYDRDTGKIRARHYYRSDGARDNSNYYDIKTGKIRAHYHYRPDGTRKSIAYYESNTGKRQSRHHYRPDDTRWRGDFYDRKTGKLRARYHYRADGNTAVTKEFYGITTGNDKPFVRNHPHAASHHYPKQTSLTARLNITPHRCVSALKPYNTCITI